jgi:hypothetical protein
MLTKHPRIAALSENQIGEACETLSLETESVESQYSYIVNRLCYLSVRAMVSDLHPYVVFLPTEEKDKILSAIFGSKAAVDLLRFALKQGIIKNIYQKDLVKTLNYSNKTIIENLKTLTKLGVLNENMEKNEK